MTENELGRALLAVDAAVAPAGSDPRQLTRAVLERDRRRIRWLAALAIACWVLVAAGVVSAIVFYSMNVAPRLRSYQAGRAQLQNDWEAWARVGEWAAQIALACVAALLLAAVSTILLVLLSRRATLRQISAGLSDISDQLKRLQPAPPGERPAPGERA